MPPIPVYTAAPITATKASGVTPQTATADDSLDASAAPAPTGTSRYTPSDQPSPNPTPTRTLSHEGPPPPQPGAVPRLPTATSTAPPPPAPSGSTTQGQQQQQQPPAPTAAPYYPSLSQPPQMGIPSPSQTYGHSQRGTATATGPGTHPPGYQQNSGLDQYQSVQAQNDPYRNASMGGGNGGRGDEEEGVWSSVVGWAQAAGKKLSDAESEVWKRINKE